MRQTTRLLGDVAKARKRRMYQDDNSCQNQTDINTSLNEERPGMTGAFFVHDESAYLLSSTLYTAALVLSGTLSLSPLLVVVIQSPPSMVGSTVRMRPYTPL